MTEPNTLAGYDEWHKEHPTGYGPWYDLVTELLAERPRLLSDARVLEIGCGWGDYAASMAEGGAREVIGEDFSPVVIDIAKSRHRVEGLSFAVGDIENIAHADGAFDVVLSCETIEHVPHPARALSEMARVLRPGGTLLLTTPNYMSITGLHRVFREATGRKWDEGGQPLVNWTMYPRTAAWARRAGLTVQDTRGDGWYVPVPRREGGLPLHPPSWMRRWVKLGALHLAIVATKPGLATGLPTAS